MKITNLQRVVVRSIRQGPQDDKLGELETLQEFEDFMTKKKVSPDTHLQIANAIKSWDPAPEVPESLACDIEILPGDAPIVDEDTTELPAEPAAPAAKKKRGGQAAARTELLGENPKEARARIQEDLPQGFYICLSGKRSIRTLHRLGSCYALPNIDYLWWSYAGVDMTRPADYDVVCTL